MCAGISTVCPKRPGRRPSTYVHGVVRNAAVKPSLLRKNPALMLSPAKGFFVFSFVFVFFHSVGGGGLRPGYFQRNKFFVGVVLFFSLREGEWRLALLA